MFHITINGTRETNRRFYRAFNATVTQNLYQEILCAVADGKTKSDGIIDLFYDMILTGIQDNFRKIGNNFKKYFPRNHWFDDECKQLKSLMKSKELGPEDRSQLQRQYKSVVQRKKRNHYQKLARKLEDMHSNNPTEYWRYWKKHRKNINNTQHKELGTLSDHYKANTDPIRNVNFDYNFMDKLAHLVDQWDPSCELKYNKFLDDIMNTPMTAEELSLAIRKAKTDKASGLDMIPVEFYKNGGAIVQNSILAVFNFIHQSGDYPLR